MEQNEKVFTQADVDRIVSERLQREKEKKQPELQQREADLTRREKLMTAKEDWLKRGLPVSLLDHIDLSKEGALEAAAAAIEQHSASAAEKEKPPRYGGSLRGSHNGGVPDPLRYAFGFTDHMKKE